MYLATSDVQDEFERQTDSEGSTEARFEQIRGVEEPILPLGCPSNYLSWINAVVVFLGAGGGGGCSPQRGFPLQVGHPKVINLGLSHQDVPNTS